MTNNLLIVVVLLAACAGLYYLFGRKRTIVVQVDEHRYDIPTLQKFVSDYFQEYLSSSLYEGNPSKEEYDRRKGRRKEIRKSLQRCMHGDVASKNYVKAQIRKLFLRKELNLTEANMNFIVPFDNPDRLTSQDCFDILLYSYKKEYGGEAITELIKKYRLDELVPMEDGTKGYRISGERIIEIYQLEKPRLSFDDKLDIIVQRVYQSYKGLGPIDEIRDQKINGVNGGTSGIPPEVVQEFEAEDFYKGVRKIPRSYDAIWIFFQGKAIHLECLSFGSEKELKRVCQIIYTFGNPGQLNESKGFIVNDMADGSRVVVVRPKMADSWVFFVRKFDDSLNSLEEQIKGKNANLIIKMLIYLMKGKQSTAITGPQAAGKTSLIKALIRYIEYSNLRFYETSFEIWARKLYWWKNIMSIRETATVEAQKGMDLLKKTDGRVTIVGEAASHEACNYVIQSGSTASEFTIFSAHPISFVDLIDTFVNSLIATKSALEQGEAERQVVKVLDFNVHFAFTESGERYVERITECIPIDHRKEYSKEYKNEADLIGKLDAITDNITDYMTRRTNPKNYEYQNIIEWKNGEYVTEHAITPKKFNEMIKKMNDEDAIAFKHFIAENWGESA